MLKHTLPSGEGILILEPSEALEAAIAHLQLIERYHQKIKRLAIVSDNGLLSALPIFAAHLVHPDVKHFPESEYEDALSWLKSSPS